MTHLNVDLIDVVTVVTGQGDLATTAADYTLVMCYGML